MGRFTDLTHLTFGPSASDQQDAARKQFAQYVRDSKLLEFTSQRAPKNGTFLLIGAATWSQYDMALLDQIDVVLQIDRPSRLTVFVFDLDECQSTHELNERIPGVGEAFQSPVVGLWIDGKIVQTAWGFEARKFVERIVTAETQLKTYHTAQTDMQSILATAS